MKFPEYSRRSFKILGFGVATLISIPLVFFAKKHKQEKQDQEIVAVDTAAIQALKVCPPCKEVEESNRAIPSYTKFKASDWVCAWNEWSGVITEIRWSKTNPNLLIYKVQHLGKSGDWVFDEYYDTELTLGKCD